MSYWEEYREWNLGRRTIHLIMFLKRESVYQKSKYLKFFDDDLGMIFNMSEGYIEDCREELIDKKLVRYRDGHTYELLEA